MEQEARNRRTKRWRWILLFATVFAVAIGIGISVDRFVNRSPGKGPTRAGEDHSSTSPSTEGPTLYTLDEPPSRTEVKPPAEALDVPVGNKVGQTAPDFTLSRLDGKEVALSDFRGRVVLLDFWATWCSPCRASMPSLEALRARYQDKGLVLVSVSLDRRQEDASRYLEENGYTELIGLWESLEAAKQVARLYGVFGIPRTFVIDRSGVIRFCGHPTRLAGDMVEPWL